MTASDDGGREFEFDGRTRSGRDDRTRTHQSDYERLGTPSNLYAEDSSSDGSGAHSRLELRAAHSDVMTIEETYLQEDADVEVRDVERFEEASTHQLFVDDEEGEEGEEGRGRGGDGGRAVPSPKFGSDQQQETFDPVSRWVANTLTGDEAAVQMKAVRPGSDDGPVLMGVPPINPTGLKRGKTTRKKMGAKVSSQKKWLCVDGTGSAELVTLTKADLTQTLGMQLRDLRLLDPMLVTSYPSAILCRERSLVVNLEYVKMIVGLERCYVTNLEDESAQNFVTELKRRLEYQYGLRTAKVAKETRETRETREKERGRERGEMGPSNPSRGSLVQSSEGSNSRTPLMTAADQWAAQDATRAGSGAGAGASRLDPFADAAARQQGAFSTPLATNLSTNLSRGLSEPRQSITTLTNQLEDLPFELRVLEAALDIVLKHMETLTSDLEASAHPALDALTTKVDTDNLERVRRVKNRMVRLTTRVETLREVLEKFLDDDADMRDMNLAAKEAREEQERIQDLLKHGSSAPNQTFDSLSGVGGIGPVPETPHSALTYDSDEEEEEAIEVVEQLLEPFFLQADNTWNKLQTLTEYIDDTEDYVNIQLDSQRNQLIRLDLILTCLSASIAFITAVTSLFAMNVQLSPGSDDNGPYSWFVIVSVCSCAGAIVLFLSVMTYSRYKRLI